jgi:hypothetical protein
MQQGLVNSGEEKAAAQAELAARNLEDAAARADTRFTQEDLDRVNAKVRRRGEDADRAARASERRLGRLAAPPARGRRSACGRAQAGPAADETADAFALRLAPIERAADVAQRRAENANMALESVKTQLALAHYEGRAWATRFELAHTKDLPRAASAYENLVGSLTALQSWTEYQKQQLDNTTSFLATLGRGAQRVTCRSSDARAARRLRPARVHSAGLAGRDAAARADVLALARERRQPGHVAPARRSRPRWLGRQHALGEAAVDLRAVQRRGQLRDCRRPQDRRTAIGDDWQDGRRC